MRGRMYPGLVTSRSIGDYTAHKIGVNAEPYVGQVTIKKHHDFLVVATSALWNVLTPKEVFDYIRQN